MTTRAAAIAISIGLAWIVATATAVRNTELVTGQYISTGVPPLPAFGILLVLAIGRPLFVRYAPRLALSRAQILLIYAMATVGVVLSGLYHVRGMLPNLVALTYWGRPGSPSENRLAGLDRFLPDWWAPHNLPATVRYYEGGGERTIPWDIWAIPLLCWTTFFAAIMVGIFSAATLLRKPWTEDERLAFPLLTLPLALTDPSPTRTGGRGLFVLGFAVAAAFNLLNIAHALWPSIPAPGFALSFSNQFPDRPWTPLEAVRVFFMLDAIGLGYFVPLDLSFSIWFFYVVNRLFAVSGTALGIDQPGFPFTKEQSAGGYIAVALFLLWRLRPHLTASWKTAFHAKAQSEDSRGARAAWVGLLGATAFVLAFCRLGGLSLWIAVPYLGIIALMALVYARMRAETGVPFQFLYPFGQPRDLLLNTLSVPTALSLGGPGSLVLLSSLSFLSNHHHVLEQSAYQLDAARLADDAKIPRRILFAALFLAVVVGLWGAFAAHLGAYYDQGSNLIPSAGAFGEYREKQARQSYELIASYLSVPPKQEPDRVRAVVAGFGIAAGLGWVRGRWVGSPFHPLGFLVANAFGDTSTSWFPMLIAWTVKAIVLRIGGLALFKRGIPFFLGLTIGHFAIGGLFWPCLTVFLPKEVGNAYHLLFGE